MRGDIVIFRGPSIHLDEAKTHLNNAIYLPPAKLGDMYSAYKTYNPSAIGLIDGNFENIPSPWHKEILYLMSHGVKIFGASSMGALRAAELSAFGMIGIGQIYQDYTNNLIEDDDEVAILHAPQSLDYAPLSDAMVDIRRTLEKAQSQNIIRDNFKKELTGHFKNLLYKNRTYAPVLSHFEQQFPIEIHALKNWLPFNKIEQKKNDAVLLLKSIPSHADYAPHNFEFQNTIYWHQLQSTLDDTFQKFA